MSNKVYIAGPVTGIPGYQIHFAKAEKVLESKGFEPVNPVAPGLVAGKGYRYYINRGLRMLEDCDFIAMLPGSERSEGARLELHYATLVGLPIMQISEDYTELLGAKMGGTE